METPAITTRVADLVRNPNSAMPSELERSGPKKKAEAPAKSSASHSVDFSPLAQKILEESNEHESNWEKTRSENVQRVQQLVHEKQYVLSPEMVDEVAHKIVAMFS
ncbi:MAG: hypothetical protein FWB90_03095 [Fibromonadales bacterium]|nr:hypothetical protein [Fibromonadales bacterium]